ncbi:hypothetical protein M431DRAFT_551768 [Trichoderma harzianum CBS 226.95]|uniref:Uncharacterized protein n=1 Tax=Trichoderma harzianum CBS 226.95 TaxID=983964 RepID=A0A2T3ZRV6_TRIHA|nr:hypothetical protein M431DRAFT_551768 [Trichoderma harzianum CBS 226.95]PTB47521.1 hypothetical protein M431DRAFT_551768 [Trichoderma harzianum CBS 226.95]
MYQMRPDIAELPPPRPGWTKITLPLITMEITQAQRKLWLLSLSSKPTSTKQAIHTKTLRDLRHRVESVGRICSSYVPIQTLTQYASSYMLHKMELNTRQQLAFTNASCDKLSMNLAIEEDLVAACPSVDRAWRAANASLELEMQRQCNNGTALKLKLIVAQKLKKRAELIRGALASSRAAEGGGGDTAGAKDMRSSQP